MIKAEYSLRPAVTEDRDLLLSWANERGVRAAAFSSREISPEEHQSWFESVLADPQRRLLLAVDAQGTPAGQIRFDLCGEEAEITVSLARACRGLGLGPSLIDLAVRELFRTSSICRVLARVKEENRRSWRAFERAGFHCEEQPGAKVRHYHRHREE